MDGGRLGVLLQELTVLFNGSLEIARLLLLHCILDEFLGGSLRRLRANEGAEYQQQQERVFMHTARIVFHKFTGKKWDGRSHPIQVRSRLFVLEDEPDDKFKRASALLFGGLSEVGIGLSDLSRVGVLLELQG